MQSCHVKWAGLSLLARLLNFDSSSSVVSFLSCPESPAALDAVLDDAIHLMLPKKGLDPQRLSWNTQCLKRLQ